MTDWENKPLGEICQFVRGPFGGSLKKEVFVKQGFAVYEQQHAIHDQFDDVRYFVEESKFLEMQRFELWPRDLIMSCSGTMGRVAIAPKGIKRGIINQALLKMTPSHAVVPEFLKYWMTSSEFQASLADQAGGVAIQNVASVSVLKRITMPLPPLPEQRRIVALLDEALEAIATAKTNAAHCVLLSADFHSAARSAAFSAMFAQTPRVRLADVVDRLTNGYVGPIRGVYVESGVPYLLARHVRDNRLQFDGRTFVTEAFNLKNKKSMLKAGDLLLVQSGHIGHCAVVGPEHSGHNCHAMIVITPKPELLLGGYLAEFFYTADMLGNFESIRSGSTVPHLTCGEVREICVPVPAVDLQRQLIGRMSDVAEARSCLETALTRKLSALDELKKSLLHQAFTGQLTAKTTDKQLEAVA